jgi:hypothetical protein
MTIDRTSGGAGYPAWNSDFNVNHPMVFNGTSPYDWETGVADLYLASPTSTVAGPATGELTLFAQSNHKLASDGLALGDLVALNYRLQHGIDINNSSSTTVQGITVNSAPGLALVSTFASGENYFSYTVAAGPTPNGATYPRVLSSCADAFNYSDSRMGPVQREA